MWLYLNLTKFNIQFLSCSTTFQVLSTVMALVATTRDRTVLMQSISIITDGSISAVIGLKKNSIPFRLLKLETTEHINHVQHVHFINKKTRGTEM